MEFVIKNKTDKTKYELAQAMKDLMKSREIEKISVSDICDGAMVSRPTFYKYFRDKYDLVNWYFDKVATNSFLQMGTSMTLREALTRKYIIMQEEGSFFPVAFRSHSQNNLMEYDYNSIYDFYCGYIADKTGHKITGDMEFILKVYCAGSIHMTVEWAVSGMTTPPEEMADLLIRSLPEELKRILPVD